MARSAEEKAQEQRRLQSEWGRIFGQSPGSVWDPLLEPGFARVHAAANHLWAAVQETIHRRVHSHLGTVLVCDGGHGFNPYDYAELNLVRGHPAAFAAERVLVKRAMTAFQWDTVLDKHVAARLEQGDVGLVVAAPYDTLFAHEELQDWEQEDHLRFSLQDLARKAERHQVPVLAFVDTQVQSRYHTTLWRIQEAGVPRRFRAWLQGGAWRVVDEADPGAALEPVPGTLEAFAEGTLDAWEPEADPFGLGEEEVGEEEVGDEAAPVAAAVPQARRRR